MEDDPEFSIPTRRELEAIRKYFKIESEFMATENYFDNHRNSRIRRNAVHTIFRYSQGGSFDAFVPYLAMNYFDRFISRHSLPRTEANDIENVRLLAICCLTIAAKMRSKAFSLTLFLKEKFLSIPHEEILRMELLVLNGLKWRMRSVTAFSFVDHFYPQFKRHGGFKRRSINEIIVQSIGDNVFTRYKPSVIALSSFLAATRFAYPMKFEKLVIKEELATCLARLIDLCLEKKIEITPAGSKFGSSPGTSTGTPPAGEGASEEAPPTDSESNQRRPGKEKMTIDEIVPAEEDTPKKLLNFDLRWVTDETEELDIPPLEIQETAATQNTPAASTGGVRDDDSVSKCGCDCDSLNNCCNIM